MAEERQQPLYAYGGFWLRLAALTVDSIALYVLYFMLATLVVAHAPLALWQSRAGLLISEIYGLLPAWVYFSFFTAVWGCTPGKRLLGLRVIDLSGRRPSLPRVLLREVLGRSLSVLLLFFGYILVGFTEEKRGLHDFIAGTWVVTTLRAPDVEARFGSIARALVARGEVAPEQLTGIHESGRSALLEAYARQHSEEAAVVDGILRPTGGVELI